MTKPTREQIKAALDIGRANTEYAQDEHGESIDVAIFDKAIEAIDHEKRPAQIIGRVIGYIIAAALGVLALAGLLAAVKVLVGVVG